MKLLLTALLAAPLALAGCVSQPSETAPSTVDEAEQQVAGAVTREINVDAAATSRASLRVEGLTVKLDTTGRFELRNGQNTFVLNGTLSRDADHVLGFVPDDAFGSVQLRTPRTFEIGLAEGHELNTMLSGLPLFVAFYFTSGSIKQYEAAITLAPRMYQFHGSSYVWVDREITTAYVSGTANPLRYRGYMTTSRDASQMTVTGPGTGDLDVFLRTPRSFGYDWAYDGLRLALIDANPEVHFQATIAGQTRTKDASVRVELTKLGMTTGAAYDAWPSQGCDDSVWACIQAKPAGWNDFGDCGTYRQVSICMAMHPN